ncbi:hypothetical protein SAMN05421678_103223 [Actinopolymorpha cephalotaxi]|uniref:Uncharacterized protein n=1 Tax=Actinopolymorpha cephalotaxi TaxID=504797 RepID=A0A1I2N8A0_9ACTN|nr:hypothetical protein [Actinopolymorpha cephalotaxi]NYH85671.1 hypothetical protein [Actinopolymorpha cephalotaxi]SFF99079.1 hypothetical protein SAMN05421678_103223 [Actinopolymorpha cephalotaxi]
MTEHSSTPGPSPSDAHSALADASRAGSRTRAAGRWWPGYLLLVGVLAFALIVAIEALFPDGFARYVASGAWAVAMGLLAWWADSHDVQPRGAGRRLLVATAIWFGGYLFVLGPIVRWRADDSLGWWALAALVLAVPFPALAALERRRS